MFTRSFRLLSFIGLISVLSLIFAGCLRTGDLYSNIDQVPSDEESIKIGAVLPLSGEWASYGIPIQVVAQIAADTVNGEGGIDGQPLEFIWEDGKCDGKDAAIAAQKLVNVDKVKIILGGFCSSETLGLSPIVERAKVVSLSSGSSSPDVTNAGDYVFRNYPSDASQGIIIADLAADLELTKVGMLTEESDYTAAIEKGFKDGFESRGGVVIAESVLLTDTDFKTQIVKIMSEGIDGLMVNAETPAIFDLLLKQLQEIGIGNVQLFGNDVLLGWPEGLSRHPELTEGMIGAEASYEKDDPLFVALVSEYEKRTGKQELDFPTYSAATYDAVMLIAEGLSRVGNNADALRDFLYGIKNRMGLAGLLTIDQNGDPLSGHKPKIVRSGRPQPYEAVPQAISDEIDSSVPVETSAESASQ